MFFKNIQKRIFVRKIAIFSIAIFTLIFSAIPCFASIEHSPTATWYATLNRDRWENLMCIMDEYNVLGNAIVPTFQHVGSNTGNQYGTPEFSGLANWTTVAEVPACKVTNIKVSLVIPRSSFDTEYVTDVHGNIKLRWNVYTRCYDDDTGGIDIDWSQTKVTVYDYDDRIYTQNIPITVTYIPTGANNYGKAYLFECTIPYYDNGLELGDIGIDIIGLPQYGDYLKFTGSTPLARYSYVALSAMYLDNFGTPISTIPMLDNNVIRYVLSNGTTRYYYLTNGVQVTDYVSDPYSGIQVPITSNPMLFTDPNYLGEAYYYAYQGSQNGIPYGYMYKAIQVEEAFYFNWVKGYVNGDMSQYQAGFEVGYNSALRDGQQALDESERRYQELLNTLGFTAEQYYQLGVEDGYVLQSHHQATLDQTIDSFGNLVSTVFPAVSSISLLAFRLEVLSFLAFVFL